MISVDLRGGALNSKIILNVEAPIAQWNLKRTLPPSSKYLLAMWPGKLCYGVPIDVIRASFKLAPSQVHCKYGTCRHEDIDFHKNIYPTRPQSSSNPSLWKNYDCLDARILQILSLVAYFVNLNRNC